MSFEMRKRKQNIFSGRISFASHTQFGQTGFSLVELMVVTAIVAILASVAIPAYVNHVNRTRQGQALSTLSEAKMAQEIFWEEQSLSGTPRYANTITCLENFGASCGSDTFTTTYGYEIKVDSADSNSFTVSASRPDLGDRLEITESDIEPRVTNEGNMKFSLFKWAFGD